MSELYAEIILPIPVATTFTYAVPEELAEKIAPGMRAIVPFGLRKYVTGIVRTLSPHKPEVNFEIKTIAWLPDDGPIVRHPQIKHWEWLADYYLCTPGEVYRAAIPAGLKIESETFVEVNPDYRDELVEMPKMGESEALIVSLLEHEGRMSVASIARNLTGNKTTHLVSRMVEAGILIISEKMVERYRSRKMLMISPKFDLSDLREAFVKTNRSQKQQQLLLALVEMARGAEDAKVPRTALLERAGVAPAVLRDLIKKDIVEQSVVEVNRFKWDGTEKCELPTLSAEQTRALQEIDESWKTHNITLLHGVTSSGKTEIYTHLIAEALRQGKQVLYLVPEIALTTQLTRRLQRVFGDRVIVAHSKFSDNERVDIWKQVLSDDTPYVVLGARSSVFLPFAHLGLVIVDEEHDASYKQNDPAPRYNGRDAAIILASMHGAKTLLGSATPSLETYYKAMNDKFGLVKLTKRYGNVALPDIKLVDMTQARRMGQVVGTMSTEMIRQINECVNSRHQSIIFRNRRGYSPIVRCRLCAWVPRCNNCDVALTWHEREERLRCHYCGATYSLPELCPQCQHPTIEQVGYGTERIEEVISKTFASAKILRMDLDTTRNKNDYEQIIETFSKHESDILVGTQMVTKGLDFSDVNVVAVVNADETINIPDFRSAERAFNMLTQVAGRAGRKVQAESDYKHRATVLVQTYKPDHPVFKYLIEHDYEGYFEHELAERRQFGYPPFTRIIYVYLKHSNLDTLLHFSVTYANRLRQLLGSRVIGPTAPAVGRVKDMYIQQIMIKVEVGASSVRLREILRHTYNTMIADPALKNAQIYYDVDPQ